jgi:hypothetical protein
VLKFGYSEIFLLLNMEVKKCSGFHTHFSFVPISFSTTCVLDVFLEVSYSFECSKMLIMNVSLLFLQAKVEGEVVKNSLRGFIELSSTFDRRDQKIFCLTFSWFSSFCSRKGSKQLLSTGTGNSCFNLLHFETL